MSKEGFYRAVGGRSASPRLLPALRRRRAGLRRGGKGVGGGRGLQVTSPPSMARNGVDPNKLSLSLSLSVFRNTSTYTRSAETSTPVAHLSFPKTN